MALSSKSSSKRHTAGGHCINMGGHGTMGHQRGLNDREIPGIIVGGSIIGITEIMKVFDEMGKAGKKRYNSFVSGMVKMERLNLLFKVSL